MQPRILVVGSLCVDYYWLGGSWARLPGGKGGNQAVAATRLGVEVCLAARLGCDPDGDFLWENLLREGVGVALTKRTSLYPTGRCTVKLDDEGNNQISGMPGANLAWHGHEFRELEKKVKEYACLVLQLEIPLAGVLALLEAAQRAEVPVVFNLAPPRALKLPPLASTTTLVLNQQEAQTYAQIEVKDPTSASQASKVLLQKAAQLVITLGAQGALVAVRGQTPLHFPAPRVQVQDSTGAGDAFCGALAFALTHGYSLTEGVGLAVQAGAMTTTAFGCQTAMPRAAELNFSLKNTK